MKFVASYSGGKDSVLALYRAIQQGHVPVLLITVFDADTGCPFAHGLDDTILAQVAESLDLPLLTVRTDGGQYVQNFEHALRQAKSLGAEACVFGNMNIEGHREWCAARCRLTGLEAVFPLWGCKPEHIVRDFIHDGFDAHITITHTRCLSAAFLGQPLTAETLERIAAVHADICGENGAYHTFVSNGPIFKKPVDFSFGEQIKKDDYVMLRIDGKLASGYRFFSNTACEAFPCHQVDASGAFNCLFCYCPLYFMGTECGGNFKYLENGVKSCEHCELPHKPAHYGFILAKLKGGGAKHMASPDNANSDHKDSYKNHCNF